MEKEKLCKQHAQEDEEFCVHATRAADYAVKKVFAILGVDVDKPESVAEFQADLRFGKKLRKTADHGALVLMASFILGLASAIYHGIKFLLTGTAN